jgi:hypothetical protein
MLEFVTIQLLHQILVILHCLPVPFFQKSKFLGKYMRRYSYIWDNHKFFLFLAKFVFLIISDSKCIFINELNPLFGPSLQLTEVLSVPPLPRRHLNFHFPRSPTCTCVSSKVDQNRWVYYLRAFSEDFLILESYWFLWCWFWYVSTNN